MSQPVIKIICYSEQEYKQRLLKRVCSDRNTWLAGEVYKGLGTLDNCLRYFEESGQRAEFEATHELRIRSENSGYSR